ncbi:hypothetical protein NKDENANG_03955 [Candidatus Entotheonellaceae bacterium PAL068K]
MRDVVRPGQPTRYAFTEVVARGNVVGTVAKIRPGPTSHQRPVLHDPSLHLDHRRASRRRAEEILIPFVSYFHRATGVLGQQDGGGLGHRRNLAAKTTANLGGNHPDLVQRQTKNRPQLIAHRKRPLGRGPHRHPATGLGLRHGGAGFNVHLMGHRDIETILIHIIGLGHALFHIAPLQASRGSDIALPAKIGQCRIALPVRVNQGATLGRLLGIDESRKRFDVELDEMQGLFSNIDVVRGHGGHWVTVIAHDLAGKYQFILDDTAIEIGWRVLRREHGTHPRQALGSTGIKASNAAMRHGTAEDFPGQDARQVHVIRIDHPACNPVHRIRLGQALSEQGVFCHDLPPYYRTGHGLCCESHRGPS